MESLYAVEIYDERKFEMEHPELLKIIQDKLDDRYEFALCLQDKEGEDVNVVYNNIFNENECASFIFDDEGHLIDFSIELD